MIPTNCDFWIDSVNTYRIKICVKTNTNSIALTDICSEKKTTNSLYRTLRPFITGSQVQISVLQQDRNEIETGKQEPPPDPTVSNSHPWLPVTTSSVKVTNSSQVANIWLVGSISYWARDRHIWLLEELVIEWLDHRKNWWPNSWVTCNIPDQTLMIFAIPATG